MLIPDRLKAGDAVGVIAPSGPFEPRRLKPALAYLAKRGYRVVEGRSLYDRDRHLAGTDEDRAADLNAMFADPVVRAILVARGGFGSARLLDRVDFDLVGVHPKALVGFSDTTALQLSLLAHTGLVSCTGVTLCADIDPEGMAEVTERSLWDALERHHFPSVEGLQALRPGRAHGPFVGGCLSLVASLVGTPHLPNLDGAILFLEDVHEAPYRVDRMLTQLRQAGLFDALSGLILGRFHECEPDRPEDGTIDDVIHDLIGQISCPLFAGLPYGHASGRRVLPVGLVAEVDSTKDRLKFAPRTA